VCIKIKGVKIMIGQWRKVQIFLIFAQTHGRGAKQARTGVQRGISLGPQTKASLRLLPLQNLISLQMQIGRVKLGKETG